MEEIPAAQYLGNGVYAEFANGMVRLTTYNGLSDDPRNVIYLDVDTLYSLHNWLQLLEDACGVPLLPPRRR